MKKGSSGISSLTNVSKTNSKFKQFVKKLSATTLSIIMIYSLSACTKINPPSKDPTDYEIMEKWEQTCNEQILSCLNMDLEKGELIKAYNDNEKTNLELSYDYDNDNFLIVTTSLEKEYKTLLEAAKENASINAENVDYRLLDKDELNITEDFINLIDTAYDSNKDIKNQFKSISSPEDFFCIVDEKNKCYEYFFPENYYKIQLNKDIPDEYFGDFSQMKNYISSSSQCSEEEYLRLLRNKNIIATNKDWNLNNYTR